MTVLKYKIRTHYETQPLPNHHRGKHMLNSVAHSLWASGTATHLCSQHLSVSSVLRLVFCFHTLLKVPGA